MTTPLDLFKAVRRLALGDDHALLELPKEVRDLVEARIAEGKTADGE